MSVFESSSAKKPKSEHGLSNSGSLTVTGRRTYSFPLAQVNFGTLSYDLIKSHSFEVNYSLAPVGALGFFFSPLKQSVNERQGVVLIAHPKVLSLLVISSPKKVGLDPPFHLPFLS